MQLWQMDITGSVFLTDGTELKLISGIDGHSRYCVIAAVVRRGAAGLCAGRSSPRCGPTASPTKCSPTTASSSPEDSASRARPRCCSSGSAAATASGNCSPGPTRPPLPAKVERWHQSLQDEFLDDAGAFCTLEEAQAAVDGWREEYNHRRPHQSLDMACPADKFRPSAAAADGLALWAPADPEPVTTAVQAPRWHQLWRSQ